MFIVERVLYRAPKCANCLHHRPSIKPMKLHDLGWCARFTQPVKVDIARLDDKMCGLTASKFRPKCGLRD
jgi:hypothetical protein